MLPVTQKNGAPGTRGSSPILSRVYIHTHNEYLYQQANSNQINPNMPVCQHETTKIYFIIMNK